jgi:hypothetical protein
LKEEEAFPCGPVDYPSHSGSATVDPHLKTITALDNAIEEIAALKQQVEILQSTQGTMAGS